MGGSRRLHLGLAIEQSMSENEDGDWEGCDGSGGCGIDVNLLAKMEVLLLLLLEVEEPLAMVLGMFATTTGGACISCVGFSGTSEL